MFLLILHLISSYESIDCDALAVLNILAAAELLQEQHRPRQLLSLGDMQARLLVSIPVVFVGSALLG